MIGLIVASLFCWQLASGEAFYATDGNKIVKKDGQTTTTIAQSKNTGVIVGLAVDVNAGKLFWSDILFGRHGIYSAGLDGSNVKHIIKDVDQVSGLTVDWNSKHLYWTDGKRKTVEIANYDGKNRKVLFSSGMDTPRGIVAHPQNQYLFWADQGTRKIERCRLDGTDRKVIIDKNLFQPNQLAIDFTKNRLMWVDAANRTLMSCDTDGSSLQTVASLHSTVGENVLFGLAVGGSTAYISAWNSGYVSVSLSTNQVTPVGNFVTGPLYSLAYAYSQNPGSVPHQCGGSSHGCSHICLSDGTAANCACPSTGGLHLDSDKHTCKDVDSMLLYALSEDGEVGYIDTLSTTNDRYLIGRSTRPSALAYDPIKQMVYWSDNQERRIYRASVTGSGQMVVLDSTNFLGKVNGLAMDWQRRRLYYTNVGSHVIDSIHYWWNRIDSIHVDKPSEHQTVINNAGRPQGLVVDVKQNQLFYMDWSKSNPQLMRADLDGTGHRAIYTYLTTPNAVTQANNQLFLVDSRYKLGSDSSNGRVISMKSDGSQIKGLYELNIQVPAGIAYDGSNIYVSDWGRGAIIRLVADWSTKTATESVLVQNVPKPSGLLYTTRNVEHPVLGVDVCENSGCEHICIPLPYGGKKCSCPTNGAYILSSDKKTCIESKEFMIVADMSGIKLINLEGDRKVNTLWESQTGLFSDYTGLVYEPNKKHVYFSDSNRHKIYFGELNGKFKEFYEAGYSVDTLAVDTFNQQLYWISTENGTIARMNVNGDKNTYTKLVTGLNKPRGLVLDPAKGYMYWTECNVLVRSDLNGRGRKVIARSKSGGCLTGIILESTTGKLYYADYKLNTVYECNMSGTGTSCKELVYLTNLPKGIYGLYKFGDFLYFTDIGKRTLSMLNMKTGKLSPVLEGMMRPTQIAVHYTSNQLSCPANQRCSYKCQPTLGGYECMCAPGHELQADGNSCIQAENEWLLTEPLRCQYECKKEMICKHRISTVEFKCQCKSGSQDCDDGSPPLSTAEPPAKSEPGVTRFHMIIIITVLVVVAAVAILLAIFLYMKLRSAAPRKKSGERLTGFDNPSNKYDRFETQEGTPPLPARTYDNVQPEDSNGILKTVAYSNPEYSAAL